MRPIRRQHLHFIDRSHVLDRHFGQKEPLGRVRQHRDVGQHPLVNQREVHRLPRGPAHQAQGILRGRHDLPIAQLVERCTDALARNETILLRVLHGHGEVVGPSARGGRGQPRDRATLDIVERKRGTFPAAARSAHRDDTGGAVIEDKGERASKRERIAAVLRSLKIIWQPKHVARIRETRQRNRHSDRSARCRPHDADNTRGDATR